MGNSWEDITPEAVLALTGPTDKFLCPLSANTFGLDFIEFEIKDGDSGYSLFSVQKDPDSPPPPTTDLDPAIEEQFRTIKYTFPKCLFTFKTIQTKLTFKVGPQEVPNFQMIERHYFRNKLIRSYDFFFGFVIPNSVNSWDSNYQVPILSDEEVEDMINHPYETTSDSFYFVDGKLVMHNKAAYQYKDE
mmetsp:Transcript_24564/g.29766  ORF Transcript_24564/g.29766 Transcript_24564/m.29766 type:complete len:189 (-) Transcript_24564:483-1049(-)|eukprot:CAMPEP_0197861150 /NCGR_PEP_ID=MMETSP1438-20131217/37031_1 /TAXON_ID=1461541 /ORGANISM="Pterosperma sp., Strain CCMP1384" /LENGTH=188 /DNA_ID=CAMNT_0043478239 /DNA_START=140 /DNA_END=706 /DNA_ORIENTATION=+